MTLGLAGTVTVTARMGARLDSEASLRLVTRAASLTLSASASASTASHGRLSELVTGTHVWM